MATEIESKHAVVSKSPAELYMAFTDMRNFLQFLPEDKKEGVEADYDSISANVQGFNLGLRVNDRTPYSSINFTDNGSPFPFSITMHFDPVPEADPYKTDLHIEMSAEINFMMKMMLGGKLKEAMDKIVDSLAAVSEGRMPEGMTQEQMDEIRKKYDI
ncbi:MAG: SRPBCC family protein [Bacteroidales bacterium]|nr:SRPBCC family protein [Bacteroidales bacterium]